MTETSSTAEQLTLPTSIPGLRLSALSPGDAASYLALIQASLDHLTRYGDYLSMRDETLESATEELSEPSGETLRMGIRRHGELIGRVDLIPKDERRCVIGYWLGAAFTGHGYATAACRALIDHGRTALRLREVYAGVTKGNVASEALLARLGFRHVADLGAYNRFLLEFDEGCAETGAPGEHR
jgi:ribosomal-protein-serine acetyltransferase